MTVYTSVSCMRKLAGHYLYPLFSIFIYSVVENSVALYKNTRFSTHKWLQELQNNVVFPHVVALPMAELIGLERWVY
jgi:hypothetical protein